MSVVVPAKKPPTHAAAALTARQQGVAAATASRVTAPDVASSQCLPSAVVGGYASSAPSRAMGPAPGFWFGFDGVAYAIDFVEMAVGRSVCMERIDSA